MQKQKFTAKQISFIGLMGALVFAGTFIRIDLPIAEGTMLHFGNIFCLLGGLLFGGIPGGLAAGFGSAIFDLTGKYAAEAWITFINKFLMALVCGLLSHQGGKALTKGKMIGAAVAGSVTYIVLYAIKTTVTQHFVMGLAWPAVWPIVGMKTLVSTVNGAIAVVASVLLCMALLPALQRAGILSGQSKE